VVTYFVEKVVRKDVEVVVRKYRKFFACRADPSCPASSRVSGSLRMPFETGWMHLRRSAAQFIKLFFLDASNLL